MKTIVKPDEKILQMVSQSVPAEGTEMKRSQFAVSYEIDGVRLLFNTLTGECIRMEDSEDLKESLIYKDHESVNKELIRHRFYVCKDINEAETYCNLLSLLRLVHQPAGIETYVILPTTYCNARCFYCYEQNYHFIAMSDETVEKVISFIEKTHSKEKIKLTWFGGEPLMGVNAIRRITKALKEKNIEFISSMITNGSLFHEDLITEAKTNWNLRDVQITLDGFDEEYNQRKNYFDSSLNHFKKVTDNIQLLLQAHIFVSIRLNTDFKNLDSMIQLADELDLLFPNKKGIRVYVHPLFSELAGERCSEIWNQSLNIEQYFADKGFQVMKGRGMQPASPYYCMVDNPAHIVINADGKLYRCEHCAADDTVGSLTSYQGKNIKKTVTESDLEEKCRHCAFLPRCTEFSNCPDVVSDCKAVRSLLLRNSLHQKLNENNDI